MKKVLIAEDEASIREFIVINELRFVVRLTWFWSIRIG